MRRRVGLFVLCGLVLPLLTAANASAQGAILELNPKSGPPGTVIDVTGAGFNPSSVNVSGAVNIRFSTRDGEPVRTTSADPQNRITTSFRIPAGLAAGEYLVIATQTSMRGRHMFGTPGRAKLQVTAAAAGATSPPAGRAASPAIVALGTAMGALMLLAGGTLAARRLRTADWAFGSYPTHSTSSR